MTPPLRPGSGQSVSPVAPEADHRLTRRGMLALLVAPPALAPAASQAASLFMPRAVASTIDSPFSDNPLLIVGGPEGGTLDPWAGAIKSTVDHLMPATQMLRISHVGGIDGVTAANQFEARTAPDGGTVLLISGAPALAWLVGDPRAQFDAGRWLPVATGLCPGIVLRRGTRSPSDSTTQLACVSTDQSLAAKLGLSLLGIEVKRTIETANPVASLLSGETDFAFIRGANAAAQARAAMSSGALPVFGLGATDDQARLVRDPFFPDIQTLPEVLASRTPTVDQVTLLTSWRAAAAATQLEFALILPWLTPAGTVAWWRRIGGQLATATSSHEPNGQDADEHPLSSLRVGADPSSAFGLAALATDTKSSLALRLWLTQHTH